MEAEFEEGPDPEQPSPGAPDGEGVRRSESPGPSAAGGDPDPVDGGEDELPDFIPAPEKLLKAILFASPEFVGMNLLRELMGAEAEPRRIRDWIRSINREFERADDPFEVVEVNNTFRLRTCTAYHPWLKKLFKKSGSRRLSQAALEILAIIAYKQPITKADVEDIRGVNVDGVLKGLLDRRLVAIVGKEDSLGAPYLYGTTREFLQYFGIHRIPQDLPKLSEFEQLVEANSLPPQILPDGNSQEREQGDSEE